MSDECGPKTPSIHSGVPQTVGEGSPAGGGSRPATNVSIPPTKPSGDQLANPILPPGLQTRNASAAARC